MTLEELREKVTKKYKDRTCYCGCDSMFDELFIEAYDYGYSVAITGGVTIRDEEEE